MIPHAHAYAHGRLRGIVAVAVTATTLFAVAGSFPANAVPTVSEPDAVALMGDYDNFWKPFTYDEADSSTGFRGDVLDPAVLGLNDETYAAINHKGAADESQAHRALIDSDYDWKQTLPDSLGPVLGKYFDEGIKKGLIPKTYAMIDEIGKKAGTGKAKLYYNFPRPYMEDRSMGGKNDLKGLAPNLKTSRVPDWKDPATGKKHSGEYDGMVKDISQAFPSGHTTYAYSVGFALATLVPELAPEVLTRSSEAGNNRVVLGVHYPLDIMGGRILGEAGHSYLLSDSDYVENIVKPAQKELSDYLVSRCSADGYGSTLADCIKNLGANDAKGYTNAFTDAVSLAPVVDRASALTAFTSRMTYNFTKNPDKAGQAPVVPAGAENLLMMVFPTLTPEQRRVVLAETEIDSGYPLDSSSLGWQRLNLVAATSAKVTLSADGKDVVKVEPGQVEASVVTEEPVAPESSVSPSPVPSQTSSAQSVAPSGEPSPSAQADAPSVTTTAPVANPVRTVASSGVLAHTGADAGVLVPIVSLLGVAGVGVIIVARRRVGH